MNRGFYQKSAKSDIYDYENRRDDLDKSSDSEGMDSFIEIYEKFHDMLSKLNIPSSIDTPNDDPGVSGERYPSCASEERSRSAEQSSTDCGTAGTSSIVDSPINVASPMETKLSLRTGVSDEALTLGTSMSLSERLLANVGLPPPPPYSEHDSAGVTSQK
ncbi:unnamed protein product [Onchocerca flexuosa]|uniref:Phosphoprotein n=1 Tax=Onchocerca flexuosa TaxID=387005 RepID=A0A183HS61_9BILA|nr:unnamed protein product [Onchocerca flexuosa]